MWLWIGIGVVVVVVIGVLMARGGSSGSSGGSGGGIPRKKCLSCGAYVERGTTSACPRCGGRRYGWG